jgi:rubrerythrin
MYLEMAGAEMGHAQKLQNVMLKRMLDDIEPADAIAMLKDIWSCQKEDMVAKIAKAKGFLESVK